MRITELSQKAREELSSFMDKSEVEGHIRILFDYYLGLNRVETVMNANEIVKEKYKEKVELALKQLKQGKPIDYIINESAFLGYPFYVDHNVLIPRPETEELVMMIVDRECEKNLSILDIGTGSGCIAIGLALEGGFSRIEGCEISKEALKVAEKNLERFNLSLELYQLDILTQLPQKKYDVVVSNPPYVKKEEIGGLSKNVKEYEPIIALTPEGDPLTFYKRMIAVADKILKPGGKFYWEIHEDLGSQVVALFDKNKFTEIELIEDMFGRDRFVRAIFAHN